MLVFSVACTNKSQDQNKDPKKSNPPNLGRGTKVWYVQNNAAGPVFDGKEETPFAKLADAEAASQAGDAIYILLGDGSTRNQDEGISLKPRQQLIGDSEDTDDLPVISNKNGPAINLSQENVVFGLNIVSAQVGIEGEEVGKLRVRHVFINHSAEDGISLSAKSNSASDIGISDATVENSGGLGIHINFSDNAHGAVNVADSTLKANAGNALQVSFVGKGESSFDISNNPLVSSLTSSGIRVFIAGENEQTLHGRIKNNVVGSTEENTAGNGITVIVDGHADATVEVIDNKISKFGSFGIDVMSRGGNGKLHATIMDNITENPAQFAAAGMRLHTGNGTEGESNALCLHLKNNTSTHVDDHGIHGYSHQVSEGTTYEIHGFDGNSLSSQNVSNFIQESNKGSSEVIDLGGSNSSGFQNGNCLTPEL